LVLLGVNLALGLGVAGHTATAAQTAEILYLVLIGASALVVLTHGVRSRSAAWILLGLGLVAWEFGEIYYSYVLDPVTASYPSAADWLFILFYVLSLVGLRRLGGRISGQPLVSAGLIAAMLGLATVWSWLVFDPVVGALEGSTASIAMTLAYPFFDLLLLCSVLVALAANGWRADRGLVALLAGFTVVGIADTLYLAEVTWGTYDGLTPLNSLWPAGVMLVAWAPWAGGRRRERRHLDSERFLVAIGFAAIAVALLVLVSDHFHRFNVVTLILATVTMVAAGVQLVVAHRDQVKAKEGQFRAQELYAAAARTSLDAIITADSTGLVCEWNEAAERTFGYTREQALGRTYRDLIVPPRTRERERMAFERVAAGGVPKILNTRVEQVAVRADGSEFPVELVLTRLQTTPPMYTAFVRDLSEQKRGQQNDAELAAIVRASEDAILSKDLTGTVTAWNEAAERLYGYSAEEAVGSSLASLICPPDRRDEIDGMTRDVLAGEIVTLETIRTTKHGENVAVALRSFPRRDLHGEICGISTVANDIGERKRRERTEHHNKEQSRWRSRIEVALETDQFAFWGQPIVDFRSNVIRHYELLLRMDIGGEIFTPDRFLPHAENCDLIRQIDRWAVRRGIEIAESAPVAVNLSAKSLGDTDLVETIESALERSSADPRDLVFEITETAAIEDVEAAGELVRSLIALGCDVSLDDFGTGYGSFTYLKHLPVTELKIDIEFIRHLADHQPDQRVVSSMVSVAETFGVRTVAEGVEDERTLAIVRDLGVDLAQGYHIGYPARMRGVPERTARYELPHVKPKQLAARS
jgi:PAS domain S-box-containing protein